MNELLKYQVWALTASFVLFVVVFMILYNANIPWENKINRCVDACIYELKESYATCNLSWEAVRYDRMYDYTNKQTNRTNYSDFIRGGYSVPAK